MLYSSISIFFRIHFKEIFICEPKHSYSSRKKIPQIGCKNKVHPTDIQKISLILLYIRKIRYSLVNNLF